MPRHASHRSATTPVVLILGVLTAFGPMSIDMYLPALPGIAREFGSTTAAAQLTLSAFFVGLALGQLVYGPVMDRWGRKPPLYAGLVLYLGASAGAALAPSMDALIACRFVQALGACAGMVVSRTIVRDLFDHRSSARVLSLLMLIMGVAPILAPLAGSALMSVAGWRTIFVLLAVFGAVCWALTFAGLPETRPAGTPRPTVRTTLHVYAGLLRHRAFVGYTLAGGLAGSGMLAYISGSSFVFIDVYGLTPTGYAWLFGTNAAGLIGSSQINRYLLHRHAPDRLLRWGNACNASFGVLLAVAAVTGWGGPHGIAVCLFAFVASLGFIFPNAAAGAMAPFGDRAGSASALMGTLQFGIATVMGALVGHFHDGTAVPMAIVIACCGGSAFLAQRFMTDAEGSAAS